MKAAATIPSTDYFSRIVAKARGAESPIAPRLPSLFEPLPGAALASMTEIEEQATPLATHEVAAAQSASVTPRSLGMHEMRPLAHEHVETPEPGDERVPRESDRELRATEAAPVAILQPVTGASRIVASPGARANEQRSDGKPEPDVRRADQIRSRRTQESVRDVSGPWPLDPHQESGLLIPQPAAVPVPYPTQRAAPATGSATAREANLNPPMEEPPAPVINVTIGRVEVRAVSASAGKPRIEPARPKPLSLDAYLKQRGGDR